MSDCRSQNPLPPDPPVPAISVVVVPTIRLARPRGLDLPSRPIPGIARRSLVPFVFASVLLHLAAVCLATTVADAHPEWFRVFRPSFRRGTVSVNLSASVASPRRETTTPIRVPPNPAPPMPAEPIERRQAANPAHPTAPFAVVAMGTRVTFPHVEVNRSAAAEVPATEPLESAVSPPRKAGEHMPRETTADAESPNSKPAAANSGVKTLEPPTKLFRLEPPYPREAFARGEHGVVKIRVRLDLQGRVTDADVLQSSGFPLLDASALETAYRWRYAPASSAGGPKAFEFVEPVRFRHPLHPE